jgi:hypothetical protein
MTPDQEEGQAETLDLINSELAGLLDRQSDSLDRIDTKATLVIGYALAAASFLATQHPELILAVLAYVAFATAAGLGIVTLAVRDYDELKPRPLFVGYAGRSRASTLAALGALRVKAFECNGRKLDQKAKQWQISIAVLVLGTLLMILAILVQTYLHDQRGPLAKPAVAGHSLRACWQRNDSRASAGTARSS